MLRNLKLVAWLEGASLLVLLFIAMPLKYALGHPGAVRAVGMIHGLLFLAFTGMLTAFAGEKHWSRKRLFLGYACAVLPFGAFWFDRKHLSA